MSQASDTLRIEFKKGDDIRDAGLTTPDDVQRFDDIRYGSDADCQLLDVYRPKDKEGEVLPVIISIHGGIGSGDVNEHYSVTIAEGLEQAGYRITTKDWLNDYDRKFTAAREQWRAEIWQSNMYE